MKVKEGDTYNPAFGLERPNPALGHYYVTVIDGDRWMPLLGPFWEHSLALANVEQARSYVHKKYKDDHKLPWYGWGTIRAEGFIGFGILNKEFNKGED